MTKGTAWLNTIILLLFAALSYVGIKHHELWFDEANYWLMAESSNSLTELFHNARYTGYPAIWPALLFLLTRFTSDPFAMQLLNICISIIAALLFLRYSSFSILVKFCIIFSYFFFFEYNLISRSYSITWLLLTAFCSIFCREKRNYLLLVLILILLANTHAFSLFISIVLSVVTMHSFVKEGKRNKKYAIAGLLLFFAAVLFSIAIMMPPADTFIIRQSDNHYLSAESISKTISFFVKGFYPLPDFLSDHFWNSNFIVTHIKLLGIVLTPVLVVVPLILFYDKPYSIAVFYSPIALIIALVFKLRLFTGVHYMGYAFMLLITALWLASDKRPSGKLYLSESLRNRLGKWRTVCYTPFIGSILVFQLAAGIYAFYMDYKYPFSEGKEVANYISLRMNKNDIVIAGPFYTGQSIGVYMNVPIFYPDENRLCTFTPLNTQLIDADETWKRIERIMDTSATKHFFIALAYPGDTLKTLQQYITKLQPPDSIKEKKEFDRGLVRGENYVVYEIEKKW